MAPASVFHHVTHDHTLDAMLEMLEHRGIDDRCVLAALTVVPREPFVALTGYVYDVARRVQALALVGDEHVLQVGVGSGYATAVLSLLSAHVYGVEPDPEQSSSVRTRLAGLGYDGISITCRDAALGWDEHGVYDAILVTERASEMPQALVDQLALGGRIVIPLGDRLVLGTKISEDELVTTDLGPAPREEAN